MDAHRHVHQIEAAARPHILYFAPQILDVEARSGVQKVVTQLADSLRDLASVDFVKWDRVDGQLRYFNAHDFDVLFRDKPWRRHIRVNRYAERRSYRFENTLPAQDKNQTWLLIPEISHLTVDGPAIYERVLAQAHSYRLKTAAIFYDLIPITNRHYRVSAPAHAEYVAGLVGVDLILPISNHSGQELARYESEKFGLDDALREEIGHSIVPVPLASTCGSIECRKARPADSTSKKDIILVLGTIEPRKRQVEVLRALKRARISERFDLRVKVVGSLHPDVAKPFKALLSEMPHVDFLGYADDAEIQELYRHARFSVFASNDEGFGLPICESLTNDTPCLAANFGAMREVGEGGGCLLIDVNDEAELGRGLEAMASDDALVEALRNEIGQRRFRAWGDYARDVLGAMRHYATCRTGDFSTTVGEATASCLKGKPNKRLINVRAGDGETWTIAFCRNLDAVQMAAFAKSVSRTKTNRTAIIFEGERFDLRSLTRESARILLEADAWAFSSRQIYNSIINVAEKMSFDKLLPTRCGFASTSVSLEVKAADLVVGFADELRRRSRFAKRQVAMRKARITTTAKGSVPLLDLVISTYNRGPFVAENVRWLLPQVAAQNGAVRLLVVDNASTDDTQARLASFRGSSHFEIVRNAVNTGMLGNLHVCSTLTRARHSWVVGDDDFITPGTLASVIEALRADPGLPFVFLNFGVYHRASLQPDDHAAALIRDPIVLAPQPSPTGIYPVRVIAAEHDNLATAIYPIVFRSDILSACFNYPFTGTPFGSLVESVPTTKIILEDYADAGALWISDVGIVGNAHNSWQRYRVQWHGVLMPLVFELAKEAGVDSRKLRCWAQTHESLYREAQTLFPTQDIRELFGSEQEVSRRVFRHRLDQMDLN